MKNNRVLRRSADSRAQLIHPIENALNRAESMAPSFDALWSPKGWGWPMAGLNLRGPEVDIKETSKEIIVSARLPGIEKENIHVDVTENSVSIRAEQRTEDEYKGKGGANGWSRSYQSFSRTLSLPQAVKAGEAKAEYKNGVLKIELSKVKESRVHRVEVA